jgi:hypothetical protein
MQKASRIILAILCSSILCNSALSQTHLTPNKEKCWIVKKIEDPLGSSFFVVVVQDFGTPEEKKKIEQILQSKLKASISDRLEAEGMRVEIFKKEDIEEIKKKTS